MLSVKDMERIEEIIGYGFADQALLNQAFTRESYRLEHERCEDSEVLEFLGDSVLSLAVITEFIRRFTKRRRQGLVSPYDEGDMTVMKMQLTNKYYLATRTKSLGLERFLLTSRSDAQSDKQNTLSYMEDLFESIVGAVYLDCGRDFRVAMRVALGMLDMDTFFESMRGEVEDQYAARLDDLCRKYRLADPVFRFWECGKVVLCTCEIKEHRIAEAGYGKTEHQARAYASKRAFRRLADKLGAKVDI